MESKSLLDRDLDDVTAFLAAAFVSAIPDMNALVARAVKRIENGEDVHEVIEEIGTATWVLVVESVGKAAQDAHGQR